MYSFLSTNFVWKISHSKKNRARYDHKCVFVFSCKVPVIIVRFWRKIFLTCCEKSSNTKFHENLSSGSRVVPRGQLDERADMTKLIIAFRNFANTPKNITKYECWYYTQALLGLCSFILTKFRKRKSIEITVSLWGSGSTVRRRWRKNTAGRKHRRPAGYVAVDNVRLCWSLDFKWTPMCMRIYIVDIENTEFCFGHKSSWTT